jgi:aspartyl-tRNA(Asn)/glutamyl-tRNA(Gln) amidotransferase subunit A
MIEISGLTISRIADLYSSGDARPTEIVEACIDGISSRNDIVGAFLEVFGEEAVARAEELEREGGRDRPLYGIPVAVKDNICTKDLPTTCASRILGGYRPPYDATVVRRLKEAGAVIVGKTNMDEFAMGSSNEYSAFRIARNPWNEECVPGGSSGGSAAAVAGGMVPLALGSDTGGSIRQPAALCGVVGLKGSYGRVSRYGLVAFASSLDQIGPMAGTVEDCAIAMQAIAGPDGSDSTAIADPCPDLLSGLGGGMGDMKIAFPAQIDDWPLAPSVRAAVETAARIALDAGATVERVLLPDMDESIACYYIIANAEASSNLARYDGVRYGLREDSPSLSGMYSTTRTAGFGEEVKRRILLGTFVLTSGYYDEYYGKALAVRNLIKEEYEKLFSGYDLVILPTTPGPAFPIGEKTDDPVDMYLSDIFTTPANVTGLPAVSVPADLSDDRLPVGVQLMSPLGREDILLRGAKALESGFRFNDRCVPGGNE